MRDAHIKIYYFTLPFYLNNHLNIIIDEKIKINLDNLEETHKLVYEENKNGTLKDYFDRFNSEDNPLLSEEKQKYIKKNKLHTPMTIGDIVVINENGNNSFFLCKEFSWRQLEKIEY